MPFKKANSGKCKGKYVSPSGRCYSRQEVTDYYNGTVESKTKSKTKIKK